MSENKELTVIDFFCGAGGFSEGFRQQGFKIVRGIDYWKPAIDSHNLNHGLNDSTKSVLDFWSDDSSNIKEIEQLEDTACIIGSPPCVSFSNSNKSGKADKTQGIKLIEAFLRVVAVKKHKKSSKLLVWYMENVPNSQKYVKKEYTFDMLSLGNWAESIGKKRDDTALKVRDNGEILDSGDYGAPQSRKRFIAGEWCKSKTWEFIAPKKTHEAKHITLGDILGNFPEPNLSKKEVISSEFKDPNYGFTLNGEKFSDHFYDTGIYIIEWEQAQYFKENHSYMGKMSFPENMNRPCRTIMATRSAKTREALILKSEYNRKGNGEYRLPTIREIASLMGFPINYQFVGSGGSKWRQIGNAVSPHVSSALAKAIRVKLNLGEYKTNFSELDENYQKMEVKLNTFKESKFDKPKKRVKNAKFRRHPFKSGNMTVELMNYTEDKKVNGKNWYIEAYFGTGEGFKKILITEKIYCEVEKVLKENYSRQCKEVLKNLKEFVNFTVNEFQKVYEKDLNLISPNNPINIVKAIEKILEDIKDIDHNLNLFNMEYKKSIPLEQALIIYLMGKIILF